MGWFEENPLPGDTPIPTFPTEQPYPLTTGSSSRWPGDPNLPGYGDMSTSNPWRDSLTYEQIKGISNGVYGPAPSGAAPSAGGTSGQQPPGGDWQSWFMSLVAGKPWNQQTLNELMPTLAQYGIQMTPPNAAGDQTKINVPGIGWVRVGFGEGHPVWIPQGSGAADQSGGMSGGLVPQNASGGGQMGLNGPFGATPFDFQFNENDPSYRFIQQEVLGAIQNSQFARGTGLTGGALKEMQDRAAGLASMEYGNEFDRAYRTNSLNFSQGLAANQNQFGQNYQLAGLGLNATTGDVNAAAGLGSTGSSYANQMSGLYGDIGNAQAGNIAGSAAARNQFYTGLLNGLPTGSRPYNAY